MQTKLKRDTNRTNTPITVTVFFLIFNLFNISNSVAQDSVRFEKLYYPSGEISAEGYMTNGVPTGYWKSYYENGTLFSEGNRKNGLLEGPWKFYNKNSRLKEDINFIADKKEGFSRIYYLSGEVRSKTPFVSGLKTGVAEYYFKSGNLKRKLPFQNNLKNGRSYTYNEEDGRIIMLEEFVNDTLLEQLIINRYDQNDLKANLWIEFHPNEKKKLVGSYVDGKKEGIFKLYDEDENLVAVYNYRNGEKSSTDKSLSFFTIEKSYYANKMLKASVSKSKFGWRQGYTYLYDSLGQLNEALFYDKDTLLFSGIMDSLGRKQQDWIYYYRNGNIKAKGFYINDKEESDWVYYYESGKPEQSGKYKGGKPVGEWEWLFENGKQRRLENYEAGNRSGDLFEYDPYGYLSAEGKYQDGQRSGKWFLSTGDQVETGKFRDGLKHGQWQYYKYELDEDAKYFTGSFYQGLPDGIWNISDEDGNLILTLEFNKGARNGSEKRYTPSGQVYKEYVYKNDELIEINGTPLSLGNIK
jgi:antitoxin component YwqK of YwqJK toxin-antitoxin module